MYDAKNEANEFVGDDTDGAVAEACRFFGVEREDLRVIEMKPGEVYGLGSRIVVVAVPLNVKPRPPQRDRGDREEGGGRREGGRDRDRKRGGRGGDRDRGDSGDRGGRDRSRSEAPKEAAPRGEDAPRVAAGPSKGSRKGSTGSVGDFLLGVVERMGLGSFEIAESEEEDFLIFQLSGPAASELRAGDGRAIDALQLLANQAAMRGSDDAPRVVVDAEGSGEDREESLERLAGRASKRALDTGRAVALDPMNGRDRRIIHMALREEDDIATMSIGEGRYRQVLVVPQGADEYQDAVASSRASDS